MKVAIVGCGPKGLFALERLLAHAAAASASNVEIDVFEPHPHPGAGPVYDPRQPGHLLMNFSSGKIDMWGRDGPAAPVGEIFDFNGWRGTGSNDYAARAEVGRYLNAGFENLRSGAPEGTSIRVVPASAKTLLRVSGDWSVVSDTTSRTYDEVMLTTGHEPLRTGGVTVETHGVPAGGRVAIRGFALTFIDTALSLTEGRGGRFDQSGSRLRYVPSSEEPRRMVPFSRTGRPMHSKPHAAAAPTSEASDAASLPTPVGDVEADLIPWIATQVEPDMRRRATDMLRAAIDGVRGGADASKILRSTLAGTDRLEQAVGAAWRLSYPHLVEWLSGAGMAADAWPGFLRLAAEMERISFGPPPVNVAKIVALADAGLLDLGHRGGSPPPADVVLNAVMPGPGAPSRGPVAAVLADGHARVPPGRRGVETDANCFCIREDGTRSDGLAAYGRPTEDWVIGNDTLNRSLHPAVDRWARTVVRGAVPA